MQPARPSLETHCLCVRVNRCEGESEQPAELYASAAFPSTHPLLYSPNHSPDDSTSTMPRRKAVRPDVSVASYLKYLDKVVLPSNTLHNQKKSRFLRLPGEIRNKIYALACATTLTVSDSPSCQPRYTVSPLRLVCKQISSESAAYARRPDVLRLEPDLQPALFCHLLDTSRSLRHHVFRCVEMPVTMLQALAKDLALLHTTGLRAGWTRAFWGQGFRGGWVREVERVAVWRTGEEGWDSKTKSWAKGVLREVFGKDVELASNANQTNSRLLRLPAELRNTIYAYVSDTLIVEASHPKHYRFLRSGRSLLSVCRQTNREAADLIDVVRVLSIHTDRPVMGPKYLQQRLLADLSTVQTLELSGLQVLGEMKRSLKSLQLFGRAYNWADRAWVKQKLPNLRCVDIRPASDHGPAFEWINSAVTRQEILGIVRDTFDRPDMKVNFM
ncbi:hypothetical protein SVAN01_08277 [Stagonosporopsis vannaccii]|nr:hypothetical protein SVAN01_08277 [Stagonosporopsis vannaccii]